MIILKANHKQLTNGARFSFLSTNYASGSGSFVIVNSNGFSADDYLLLGSFGTETAEIVQIDSVAAATHTVTLKANTKFAHSESTKVTILKYNQVKFYYTTTDTYSAANNLSTEDIQADDFNTKYIDTTNATGFGWFIFFNETTTVNSQPSNAIPYAGFAENSVREIIDSFHSLLNNKEIKIITSHEEFRWLNEGYTKAQNVLNTVNPEYTVQSQVTVSVTAGTAEYDLPTDFGQLVRVADSDGDDVKYIDMSNVIFYNNYGSESLSKYYLRGRVIGFSPVPTQDATYYLFYRSTSTVLTSYYDKVHLPNSNFYFLVDFMLYRASDKLKRSASDKKMHLDAFKEGMAELTTTSHKQNENRDKWDLDDSASI